jgi:hypothetical protein
MGFFARGGGPDDEQQSGELARIEGGGIPSRAEERLKALGKAGSLFTSGLSVKEFALLDRMGPQPLAHVIGASVVRTGWQYLPALDPDVVDFSASAGRGYGARATGYALTNRSHGWGSHVIEFFALGTAIVATDNGSKIEPPVTVLDLNDPR